MTQWTPLAWHYSPEQLTEQARQELFQSRYAIEHGALETAKTSMSGHVGATANEQEILLDATSPGHNVADTWLEVMDLLHATEPMFGRSATSGHTELESPGPPA